MANSEKLARPFNSFSMHPHVQFVIMEAILEQLDTTLAEIAYIALNRQGQEARILFGSNVCFTDPEIFVFLDGSRFLSFY